MKTYAYALVALFVLPTLCFAEEAPPTSAPPVHDPAGAFRAKVEKLPAPSKDDAFEIRGAGTGMGLAFTVMYSAEPTLHEGKPAWHVKQHIQAEEEGTVVMVMALDGLLDPQLRPLTCTESSQQGPLKMKRVTTRKGDQFHVITNDGKPEQVAAPAHPVASFSALLLFLKHHLDPADKATYSADLMTDIDKKPGFEARTWRYTGTSKLGDKVTHLVAGKGTDGRGIQLHYDKESKELLGGAFTRGETPVLTWTVGGAPAGDGPSLNGAVDVGLELALGFATAQADLIEKNVHWPTVYAEAKASHAKRVAANPPAEGEAEPFPELENWKASVVEELRKRTSAAPKEMIQQMLPMLKPQVQVTAAPKGRAVVQFPPMFRSLRLDMIHADARWWLAAFPKAPGK